LAEVPLPGQAADRLLIRHQPASLFSTFFDEFRAGTSFQDAFLGKSGSKPENYR